jgi:hypothetical protein
MFTRVLVVVVLAALGVAASAVAQGQGQGSPAKPESPSGVARLLSAQGEVLEVPSKGKVHPPFKKDSPQFSMPGGPSPVALLRLPEYQVPYGLIITSARRGIGRTTEIFVPSMIFFDADFNELGSYGAEGAAPDIALRGAGVLKEISKEFQFDDSKKDTRYVLIFTRADMVGGRVAEAQGAIATGVVKLIRAKVERSFEGNVQVETKPQKAGKTR